jgi:peptidoglycan hydrolase-like protein with peptidoglycan-binding domain/DNA invertase Pin-like site-specific DNA recombinase
MLGGAPARAAESAALNDPLLATGAGYAQPDGSTQVKALQRRLRTLGLRPGRVDGLFGPRTEAAVERFQLALGLRVDGIVGPRTRLALSRASGSMVGRGAGYDGAGGSTRVRRLQLRLRELGLEPGPVDGLYGPRTKAAVERFQRASGLTADGVAWPQTRRSLARHAAEDERPATTPQVPVSRRAPETATTSEDPEEPPELPLLVMGGVLAFALVAVLAPLVNRVALATKPAMPALSATPPDDRPPRPRPKPDAVGADDRGAASRPSPPRGERDRLDAGDGRPEAVGYVTAPGAGRSAEAGVREQIAAIDALCERRGWRLIEVARDVGDAPRRPGLDYAVDRLAGSEGASLVVAELRRLGGSAAELSESLGWLRDRGVRLVAADVDLDTETPDGRITADALISVGALERSRPRATPTPEQAGRPGRPAVRDVPELRKHILAMRSAGMTLQAIADRLNEEGFPTLRGGKQWRPSSVQNAAGYKRPRQLSTGDAYDWRTHRRRAEDR